MLRQAADHDDGKPLPDGCPSVKAAVELMTSLFVLEGFDKGRESAQRADRLINDSSPFRPIADLAVASSALAHGDLTKARTYFSRVLVAGEPLIQAQAIGWLTVVDVLEGDSEGARVRIEDADPILSQYPGIAENSTIVTARAVVELSAGRPLECAALLTDCLRDLGSTDPAMRLEVMTWLASAEAAVGRTDRAREMIRQARILAESMGGSAWHSTRLDAIAATLAADKALVGIDPGLTDREVRILQLLASTHLSQREIGRELNIAFNTVKSHVKSIYVKIGASTREEASQISRARGLV
jgi:LuxR family maltose regulon positive regulatory protein